MPATHRLLHSSYHGTFLCLQHDYHLLTEWFGLLLDHPLPVYHRPSSADLGCLLPTRTVYIPLPCQTFFGSTTPFCFPTPPYPYTGANIPAPFPLTTIFFLYLYAFCSVPFLLFLFYYRIPALIYAVLPHLCPACSAFTHVYLSFPMNLCLAMAVPLCSIYLCGSLPVYVLCAGHCINICAIPHVYMPLYLYLLAFTCIQQPLTLPSYTPTPAFILLRFPYLPAPSRHACLPHHFSLYNWACLLPSHHYNFCLVYLAFSCSSLPTCMPSLHSYLPVTCCLLLFACPRHTTMQQCLYYACSLPSSLPAFVTTLPLTACLPCKQNLSFLYTL